MSDGGLRSPSRHEDPTKIHMQGGVIGFDDQGALQERCGLVQSLLIFTDQCQVAQAFAVVRVKFQCAFKFRLGLFPCAPMNERSAQIAMRAGVLGSERHCVAKNLFGFLRFAHLQQ